MTRYCVYILTNHGETTLYIGMSSKLPQRIEQHRAGVVAGFTQKYKLHKLIWFECFDDPQTALDRERQLKGWRREKKEKLIASVNPEWRDVSADLQIW
jgi:putative endonuclease